jgi:peroxiredoxin
MVDKLMVSKLEAPIVGALAPDFTLPSTAGRDVTLSEYRGVSSVLLAFFPLAFTSTCTAELCGFGAELSEFESADAVIFGVSVDSIPTLAEFKAKHDLSVDLLSDFRRDVSRLYGTLLDGPFFSSRSYFVIDRQGVLQWAFTEENLGDKRSNEELLRILHSIRQG